MEYKAVRIASSSEDSLSKCVERELWAGRAKLPRDWVAGDILLVRVDSALAAVAEVLGQADLRPERTFDPKFPMVVPVRWVWVPTRLGERVPFDEWIKSELRAAWGPHYGFRILNQTRLPEKQSRLLLQKLTQHLPSLVDDGMRVPTESTQVNT